VGRVGPAGKPEPDPYPRIRVGSDNPFHWSGRVGSGKKFTGTGRPGFTRRFVATLETSQPKQFTGPAGRTSLVDAAVGQAALTHLHHDRLKVLLQTWQ
jgi:hypothetical protein